MNLVEQVRHFLNYSPDTGVLTWKEIPPRSRAKKGEVAGSRKTNGYIRIYLAGKEVFAHRAAWMHFYGEEPEKLVDHINGDVSDNRICNLRLADLAENNWNRQEKSSISGACQHKRTGLWTSLIRHRGKRLYLGVFKTKEEAQQAYQAAAKELRGEFHEHQ